MRLRETMQARGQPHAGWQIPWLFLLAGLVACAALYTGVAISAIRFPFGLDYSEGLIWQEALSLGTPRLYGDITHFPFLVCEYPPLYLVALRALGATGIDMLAAGRLLSILSAIACCGIVAALVFRFCRLSSGAGESRTAACVAGLLPLSLLPIASWSLLMRVDTMAMALNAAGLLLGAISFRRPRALYPAVLFFVAAVFTKQIFIAGAVALFAVSLMRDPRRTLVAYAGGLVLGAAVLGYLQAATGGRFFTHVFLYTADKSDLAMAVQQSALWLAAYPADAVLVCAALILAWRRAGRPTLRRLRAEEPCAWLVFLSFYLALTTLMLAAAGKTGASRNYFIEWMLVWCVWIGWLCGAVLGAIRMRAPGWIVPALLLLQLVPVIGGFRVMQAKAFSSERRSVWGALLARVRGVPGPLLSDDMVLNIRAGRTVDLEPCILLELARAGRWDETLLLDRLKAHFFGAVITAYDPGDPTFDIRYLPHTRDAILANYPRVERFGDYRLRLP